MRERWAQLELSELEDRLLKVKLLAYLDIT